MPRNYDNQFHLTPETPPGDWRSRLNTLGIYRTIVREFLTLDHESCKVTIPGKKTSAVFVGIRWAIEQEDCPQLKAVTRDGNAYIVRR